LAVALRLPTTVLYVATFAGSISINNTPGLVEVPAYAYLPSGVIAKPFLVVPAVSYCRYAVETAVTLL
jgi:hypothetical protein